MHLKPLPPRPLCHHKAFAESVSIHPDMGAAGAAAIPGKKAQFTRHNSLNALQPVLPALTAETSSAVQSCTPKYRGITLT